MFSDQIVSKVWSFCNTLLDGGMGYGDYLEQLHSGNLGRM
jgi:type I restriction enzyme M protein